MSDLSLLDQGLLLQRASVQARPDFTITADGERFTITPNTPEADAFALEFIWRGKMEFRPIGGGTVSVTAEDCAELADTMACHGLTVERKA